MVMEKLMVHHPVTNMKAMFALSSLQLGSQHRDKAEPAGAVISGKWVPSTGAQTLTGPPPGPRAPNLDK